MKSILAVALMTAVALAGCSDEPSVAPAGGDGPIAPPPEAGLGQIRGVVLDPVYIPIAAATVSLSGTDLSQTTDEDGGFVFNDLEPGTYFITASKVGFSNAQASTEVVADEARPPVVKMQLIQDPSSIPTADTHDFQGYLACSVTAVAIAYPVCALEPSGSFGEDANAEVFDMPRVPDYIQGELYWKSTQDAGAALRFNVWAGTSFDPVSVAGTSPLAIRLDAETMRYGNGTETEGEDLFYDDGKFAWRVFPDGIEGSNQEICPDDVPGVVSFSCLFGAGVVIDQPFTMYTTQFFGITPDEEWMYVTDGTYPVDVSE